MSYDYGEETEYRSTTSSSSELMGALGTSTDPSQPPLFNPFQLAFPGPYHPDYLMQLYNMPADALPFSSVESSEIDMGLSPRSTKRRRMSTDSASEPPSSAVSFGSYSGDSFSSTSSSASASHSKRCSMEFPFSTYNSNGTINQGPALRGSGNTFWHPPMMPQSNAENEPALFHPPMLGPANGNNSGSASSSSSASSQSSGSSSGSSPGNEDSPMDYLHPPMALQDEESLFSAYLHPPMAIPNEEAGKCSPDQEPNRNNGPNRSGIRNSMFSDPYFQ
jgi:hypothetical protein